MRRLLISLVVALFVLPFAAIDSRADDTVVYGCAQKITGILRIVSNPQHCFTRVETPISWNRTGPAGPTGPTGPQGIKGPPGSPGAIKVYDADEQYLGIFVSKETWYNTSYLHIFVPELNAFADLAYGPGSSGTLYGANIYFDQENCAGNAYFPPAVNPLPWIVPPSLFSNDNNRYRMGGNLVSFTVKSHFFAGEPSCVNYYNSPEASGYPASIVGSLPFDIPVLLPFRFEAE